MVDRSIPFYNIIMKCDHYEYSQPELPEGFSIVPYKAGYENDWALLEYNVGDFSSVEEAKNYFLDTYLQDPTLAKYALFLLNPLKEVVGSCIAWKDMKNGSEASSLHWLIVDNQYRGMGLGRALCRSIMNIYHAEDRLPVYIHTQPWSWKAVLLYHSVGFRIQKKESFSHYENEYESALAVLKNLLTQEQYAQLEMTSQ